MLSSRCALAFATLMLLGGPLAAQPAKFSSHPPQRPLPTPSNRPMEKGPAYFVDAAKGNDAGDGTQGKPWKTVGHGATKLKPGDTLYLRGGIYYEHATVTCSGTADRPITIRSYPNELAIIDGGLREFFDNPAAAWQPCPGGAAGEFQSTQVYPDLGGKLGDTNVLGRFGDSLNPLHGYRFISDLRSGNEYWNIAEKVGEDKVGIYCGPGLFWDPASGRIHIRLAHTTLKGLHDDNYRGETDPRKLPLIVAGLKAGPALTLREASHLQLQDLVIRGARAATLDIDNCAQITLDGVTAYAGATAARVVDTHGLRVWNTACRGIAAPWTFRGHLKYRAIEARIFSGSGWEPTGQDSRDFELAYSEFTDSVDGVFIGNVQHVRFHHNLLDNVSDDGIFLTAATAFDGTTPGGDVHIYQNLLSRCLTTFAFGVGHGRQKAIPGGKQMGAGVSIYRNVFDFRRPVHYQLPESAEGPQEITFIGRFAGDHGGPTWEPMNIYHNTILTDDPGRYAYSTSGLSAGVGGGTRRRVFNNIIMQRSELPGSFLPDSNVDFQGDFNLHWSAKAGPDFKGELFAKFLKSKAYEASKARYPAGWTTNDRFADPQVVKYDPDWKAEVDLRLQKGSPAIDAGVPLPAEWSDPLKPADAGKPDLGAVPLGAAPCRVGVNGRLTLFGGPVTAAPPTFQRAPFQSQSVKAPSQQPVAMVKGYPAFDADYLQYVYRRQGIPVDVFDRERGWLNPKEYGRYRTIILVGSLLRAKMEPNKYDGADFEHLRKYLEQGGTLLVTRSGMEPLATPAGRDFLAGLTGGNAKQPAAATGIRIPAHPWIKHLDPKAEHPWLTSKTMAAWRVGKGDAIIGSEDGSQASLYHLPVGKGKLVYVGWEISESIPHGRLPSTPERERIFEEQIRILQSIVAGP